MCKWTLAASRIVQRFAQLASLVSSGHYIHIHLVRFSCAARYTAVQCILHQRMPAADNVLGKQMLLDEHVREKLYDLRVFPPVGEDREGWDQNQAADFLGMVQEAALLALDHTALVSHTLYRQPS